MSLCPNCGADLEAWASKEAFGEPHSCDQGVYRALRTLRRNGIPLPKDLTTVELEDAIKNLPNGEG